MSLIGSPLVTKYGNFVFNGLVDTTAYSITPMQTADGRSTAYNNYHLQLTFEIDGTSSIDPVVKSAISELTHQGSQFIYNDRGTGLPNINTGGAQDVKWGPRTKIDSIQIIGWKKVIRFVWSIDFALPACPILWSPVGSMQNELLEYVFDTSFMVDEQGYTTRSVSGHLTVANNRTAPGTVTAVKTADDYRDRAVFVLITGFRRIWHPFKVSQDRSRLEFGWDDIELPQPLPLGIIECLMSDDVSTVKGLQNWTGSISAEYKLARGYRGSWAASIFIKEIKKLVDERARLLKYQGPLVPTGFTMRNSDRYGKPKANFSFSYFFTCPFKHIFKTVDIFEPPDGPTYMEWVESVRDTALNVYGGAKIRMTVSDDRMYDPCYGLQASSGKNPGEDDDAGILDDLSAAFPKPSASESWVAYEAEFIWESDTGTIQVKTIEPTQTAGAQEVFGTNGPVTCPVLSYTMTTMPNDTPSSGSTSINRNSASVSSTEKDNYVKSKPSVILYFRGMATRVGWPISPPELLEINGVKCVPASRPDMGECFKQKTLQNAVNTIYTATWKFRYQLSEVPKGPIPQPKNPMNDAK